MTAKRAPRGKKATAKPALVLGSWAVAAAPPPKLTVSEWADQTRLLPETSGARGARWRTDSVPYLRGIMDAVHEPGITKIAVMKCHQVGGSEAMHNVLGYFIEYDPCPMLFVHPTSHVADEWSKERLSDMVRSTPALASVVREKRSPRGKGSEDGSTLQLKMFPGGFLALGGANTPNTFARRSVRIALGDDVDRFPAVVGEEGDPADLLHNRTTSFYDGFSFFVSTPTIKGGRIDALYERSDQRKFFLACPDCGREDFVTWRDPSHFHVGFDDRQPETARLQCASPEFGGCGVHLSEPERRQMILLAGRRPDKGWRPTTVAKDRGVVGFQLPAMLSTLGSVTLQALVEKWLSARERGKESLRVFINTALAEGWEDRSARMDPHALVSKREDYGDGIEVPQPAVVLTAGVDVQLDRFELQVFGWGPGNERWVVDYRVIPGDPKQPETRTALLEALGRRYVHASGHQLPISATCIDTGFAAEEMYDFVLAYQARRIYATKGFAGKSGEPIVGKPAEKRHGRHTRPVRLYPINVDDAKGEVMNSLSLVAPGPGFMHFPTHLETVHEEYFAQLCAEHRETRYNKSNVATHFVWVQDRERNEALDTAVLALAAFRLLNPNVRQMAETLASIPVTAAPGGPVPPPPSTPPPVSAPGRRVVRSRYLG